MASIGPDKVNHLRHVEFFGSADGVRAHMRRHREIIAPKFAAVDARPDLGARRARRGRVDPARRAATSSTSTSSTAPRRGWSQLAKEAGIALTPAGASFPYGQRPARPEHPAGADVPAAGPGGDGHGRRRDLRGAGRGREAGRRRLSHFRSGTECAGSSRRQPNGRVAGMSDESYSAEELNTDTGSYSLDDEDQLQPEDTLVDGTTSRRRDVLDAGYSPPDRARGSMAWGTTAWEQSQGRDHRAADQAGGPRPGLRLRRSRQRVRDGRHREMVGGDDPDAIPAEDDFVGDGDRRAGRLVDPDEGVREDAEKDLVAEDVGIDGAGASRRGGGDARRPTRPASTTSGPTTKRTPRG